MIKKTVTFKDFLGTERTQDLYFNLTRTELSDMQMSVEGGLDKKIKQMIDGANVKDIYNAFVDIVLAAYGELSPDGIYHLKEDENGHKLYKKFKQSLAYEALMDEICQSTDTITEFIKGVIPHDLPEEKPNGEFHPNK